MRVVPKPTNRARTCAAVAGSRYIAGLGTGSQNSSLDEERREIADSVMGALAGNLSDPDQMAACSFLLKHLADTSNCPTPSAA